MILTILKTYLRKIYQITYSLYWANNNTKKLCSITKFNTVLIQNRFYILINSGSSKKSDHHRQLFNIRDKINLKRKDKYVALSKLSI